MEEKDKENSSESNQKKSTMNIENDETQNNEVEDNELVTTTGDKKKTNKNYNGGISLGAKIAAIVVVAVIIILLCLKSCKKKGEYVIKFSTNGGTEISEQYVSANGKVKVPSDPTKEGYTFVGWYLDGKRYDFDSKVNSDLVIEAKWEETGTEAVTGVELDQTEAAILPTDSILLIATVEPSDAKDKTVTWKSSDESVATVDEDGNVTAKSIGFTTITVTTNDGEFTATCRVVVSEDVVKITGLSLSKKSITLGIDETEKINTEITPSNATNKGIIWKSDDPKIATVSSTGVIRGIKKGETTITATTKDGSITESIKVKVKEVSVEKIEISSKDTVELGKTKELEYKVLPTNAVDKELVWESSNESVATVDSNGKVTGKKEGKTAVITVKTKDGKVSSTCKVTVSKPVAVTGISFEPSSLILKEGESKNLKVTISPSNAVNTKYQWDKSKTDSNVADVVDGKVTAKSVGETDVSVKSDDGGHMATCHIKVNPDPSLYKVVLKVDENGIYTLVGVTKNNKDISFNEVVYGGSTLSKGDTISSDTYNANKTAKVIIDSNISVEGVSVTLKK